MLLAPSKAVIGAVLGTVVLSTALLSAATSLPDAAHASPRSTAEGLLVFAVQADGHPTEYASIGATRTPFGGEVYDDLATAIDNATELDLSGFDEHGRIKLKAYNTCLGVTPATPTAPARATAQSCNAQNASQEWRIDADADDRLRNIGTGLYVQSVLPFSGWALTDTPAASGHHLLPDYIDGRPVVQPVLRSDYDFDTDTFTLIGRSGPADTAIALFSASGDWTPLGSTDEDGSFSAAIPAAFGDQEFVEVAVGRNPRQVVELREPAVTALRCVLRSDGTFAITGTAVPGPIVHVGTGPLFSDIVTVGDSGANGLFELPLPNAKPGDTFTVWVGATGVRTKVTVPEATGQLTAVDSRDTVLDPTRSTPVPVGVRAEGDITRITSTMTLTAPAGTVFTPGVTTITGEHKPAAGAWSGDDARFRITDVQRAPDGRTLTATFDAAEQLETGDELRWWPTLDVVHPDLAPASV